jgi:chromatin remodeling complex protein RSC6
LSAYKCHAFVDFREVTDVDGKWKAVYEALNGMGYWAVQAKFDEMFAPVVVEEIKDEPKPKKTRKKAAPKKVAEKKETSKKEKAAAMKKKEPKQKKTK